MKGITVHYEKISSKFIVIIIILFVVLTVMSAMGGILDRLREGMRQRKAAKDKEGQTVVNEKIAVIGEASKFGIYDPSVEYDDKGIGWLSYTGANETGDIELLETHLAKSTDRGKTWTKIGKANSESRRTLAIAGVETKVSFRQETSSLLFDPSDPDPDGRWKLFTGRGFTKGTYKETDWGSVNIAYRQAKSPEQLYSSKETFLFGSSSCKPPLCTARYDLNPSHQDLNNVTFYMEPGSLFKNGVLYLTLSAVSTKGQDTILLSSNDHGKNWKFLGIITTQDDAKSLGYNYLTASSLAEEGGRVFLLIAPVKLIPFPRHLQYTGVYIFEFEDISKAKLKRDNNGKLIVQKYIPPVGTKSVGGGQSDYHEQNTYGGIVMAQSDPAAPEERFKVYSTKQYIAK